MKPELSVIIPAYNEEARLGNTLSLITQYLRNTNLNYEIIVSDDGSRDRTKEVARSFEEVKVIGDGINYGKGAAVRRGMLAANGEYRLFTDADLSTPIYEIEKLKKFLKDGYDVCIGSRAVDYKLIRKHQPFYREFMGKTFNKIVQLLVVKGIKDTQCGFKCFREKAAVDIFSRAKINGFSFDVEILYLAQKLNYKIKEVGVEWYNDERTTVDPIKDSTKMFAEILKIRRIHSDLK
ncbi:MAG TPA: glycosyltransferase family 2 protein [Candidatus Kapabacteria bacterium]|jgi:dolichyl-phosphate beta-glucosyltransferase|nr:glycosyltransferase family 2 protein [Candidatus Kapabacteria bacterium]HPU24232.1 glycosyltransferase family 2 protein [Candidatus Kapabacteria bacterium]